MPSPVAAVLAVVGLGILCFAAYIAALATVRHIRKLREEAKPPTKPKRRKMKTTLRKDEEAAAGAAIGIGLVVVALVIGGIFWVSGLNNIGAGERGVVFHSDGTLDTLSPGMYQFRNPISTDVIKYNVQTRTETATASAASRDLQEVTVEVAVQFHPDPQKITEIHQNIGHDYMGKVLRPAVQEAVKSSTARFGAAEIIQNRPIVKEEIERVLQARVASSGLILDQVSLTNIQFSSQFTDAIEKSQTAKQNVILEQNKLEVIRLQANQSIEQARAQAETARIVSLQIQQNPAYIQYLYAQAFAENWNGVLPPQFGGSEGGAIPFVNVGGTFPN